MDITIYHRLNDVTLRTARSYLADDYLYTFQFMKGDRENLKQFGRAITRSHMIDMIDSNVIGELINLDFPSDWLSLETARKMIIDAFNMFEHSDWR